MNQSAKFSLCVLAVLALGATPAFGSETSLAAVKARTQRELELNMRDNATSVQKQLRQEAASALTPAVLREQLQQVLSDTMPEAVALTTARVKLARAD